jgi:hypothetical protein
VVTPTIFCKELNAVAKLKKYKSQGIDLIAVEFIQAGGETLGSETHELINSIWNKD